MTESLSKESNESDPLQGTGQRTILIGEDSPIRISTGHRILHHDGECSRPHGHNYEITVKVTGELTKEGWFVDKGEVTNVIDAWDHMFLVEEGDPLIDAFEASGDEDSLVVLEHPPTTEVMSVLLEKRIRKVCADTVSDVSVSVRETSELCATY